MGKSDSPAQEGFIAYHGYESSTFTNNIMTEIHLWSGGVNIAFLVEQIFDRRWR